MLKPKQASLRGQKVVQEPTPGEVGVCLRSVMPTGENLQEASVANAEDNRPRKINCQMWGSVFVRTPIVEGTSAANFWPASVADSVHSDRRASARCQRVVWNASGEWPPLYFYLHMYISILTTGSPLVRNIVNLALNVMLVSILVQICFAEETSRSLVT